MLEKHGDFREGESRSDIDRTKIATELTDGLAINEAEKSEANQYMPEVYKAIKARRASKQDK